MLPSPLLHWAVSGLLMLALFPALALHRTFVVEPFRLPGASMAPTLLPGDHVLVAKSSYGVWLPPWGLDWPGLEALASGEHRLLVPGPLPARGDVVVLRLPHNEALRYVKRVVALPGDTVRVEGNRLFLNGEAQAQAVVGEEAVEDDLCRLASVVRRREQVGAASWDVFVADGPPGRLANYPRDGGEDGAGFTVPEGHVFVLGDHRDSSEDSRSFGPVRLDQIEGHVAAVWFSWDGCANAPRGERFFSAVGGGAP